MNSDEIREAREAIDLERAELHSRRKIEDEELSHKYRMLMLRCKHPNKHRVSYYDGSSNMYCPDCKWES